MEELKKYWDELNKEYGLDFEFPKDFDTSDKTEEIEAALICGATFDSAIQGTF